MNREKRKEKMGKKRHESWVHTPHHVTACSLFYRSNIMLRVKIKAT